MRSRLDRNLYPTYQDRKDQRRADFMKVAGKKLVTCTACSGSGRYDHNGSPRCSACGGTGKERNS